MIKNLFKKFRQDEDGAVVDWVVLTGTAGVTGTRRSPRSITL
jgi:hypothetical protein